MSRIPLEHESARVLLVTASDSRFFPLLQKMLETLRPEEYSGSLSLACFDIGLTQAQRNALSETRVQIVRPTPHFGISAEQYSPALLSFLARPFLPQDFPGYDIYLWVDSDLWFQNPRAIDVYITGARDDGFAITHESERSYRFQAWLFAWTAKHFLLGYGPIKGAWLLSQRHLNAGMFAGRAEAPHWDVWKRLYQAAITRSGKLVPHDQFALVQALHGSSIWHRVPLKTRFLDPSWNWIVSRGEPMWNDAASAFCRPYPPYVPIDVIHLAGPGKSHTYRVRRTSGGSFETFILPGVTPEKTALTAMSDLPSLEDPSALPPPRAIAGQA